jgi:hypothetical protein
VRPVWARRKNCGNVRRDLRGVDPQQGYRERRGDRREGADCEPKWYPLIAHENRKSRICDEGVQ